MKDYLQFLGKDDPVVIKAREVLDQGKSFPEPPSPFMGSEESED